MQHHAQAARRRHHRHVAVLIGSPDRHAQAVQVVEQPQRRVAVGVVSSDGDDPHPRVHSTHEFGAEVGAAVMRDFQHFGVDRLAAAQQILLRVDGGVSGEQDGVAAHRGPNHQRRLVRIPHRGDQDNVRGDHLQVHRAGVDHRVGGDNRW